MSALLVETAFFRRRVQAVSNDERKNTEQNPAEWIWFIQGKSTCSLILCWISTQWKVFSFSKAWAFFRPTSLREQLNFFANKCSWKTRNEKLTMWWDSVLPWSIFSIPHFILLSFPCVSWVTCTSSYTRNLSLTYPFLVHWGLLKKTFKTWNCSQ